jgi:hypothetical protein
MSDKKDKQKKPKKGQGFVVSAAPVQLARPPGPQVVMLAQPQQYMMSQQVVQQNGVTYVQQIATPVQMVYAPAVAYVQQPQFVAMHAQPVMMAPGVQLAQPAPIQLAKNPAQQHVQMATPPQQATPPSAVQLAQVPPSAAAAQPSQSQYPVPAYASQQLQQQQQQPSSPYANNYPQLPETAQLARPPSKQQMHTNTIEQVPNLYSQAVAQSRSPSAASASSTATSTLSRTAAAAAAISSAGAKSNYAPAPSLRHEASAPSLTIDNEFDKLKTRNMPKNETYGSLSMSLKPESQYGTAPPERTTYDTVPAPVSLDDDNDYPTAPIPGSAFLAAMPDAPSHKPADDPKKPTRSKVQMSQQQLYS